MPRIKNGGQVMTGIFLILVALLAFYLSWRFRTFSELGIGVGFVPRMFASIQVLLGLLLIASGFLSEEKTIEGGWPLRPSDSARGDCLFRRYHRVHGLGCFGRRVGAHFLHRQQGHEGFSRRWRLQWGPAIFSVLVFAKALGLAIPIWPAALLGG